MFAIALPMIISNIAAPMLGLVDTAIIGHLPDAIYLSAVAIGAMVINFVYLLAIFLRMSTTGVVAQSFGSQDRPAQQRHFIHGLVFALGLGLLFIFIQPLLLMLVWQLVAATPELQALATEYIQIRLWGAPAALMVLVVLGVLLGRQQARSAMVLVILTNAINVTLDVILIIGLNMNVAGAAWASVGAEWVTALAGLYWVCRSLNLGWHNLPMPRLAECRALLSINQHILVRSIVLQLCMAMMTAYASYYGATTVAANAVLMQFLMLISLGLDGIAYASEALLGEAKGQRRSDRLRHWFRLSLFWSALFAVFYSLMFALFGVHIIGLITNIEEVISTASNYLPWLIALPLIAHWSYLFDGVYIGLSQSKAMRDSMILAAILGFLPAWYLTLSWQNHGLWFALSVFMASRGLWQWWLLHKRQMLSAESTPD
ncbi:MAG: MATE family efflux transporter [Gammaproteobacteria bacterium]|nr:MATE family efflux transporter [Gammaproteobacteria bacterium]